MSSGPERKRWEEPFAADVYAGVGRMEMPNAAEIIERLARENERLKIEIERLKAQLAEKG